MARQGDNNIPRSVQVQFDDALNLAPNAGGVLLERLMRSMGVRRLIGNHLPERPGFPQISMLSAVYSIVVGALLGGRGMQAAERLRENQLQAQIFGLNGCVPSPSTTYRVLCELAGLEERQWDDVYVEAGRQLPRLDLFGQEKKEPRWHRQTPETPEAASLDALAWLAAFETAMARAALQRLPNEMIRIHGFLVGFADGTDLEVEGSCFDAACEGRHGEDLLRWMTVRLGPVTVCERLCPGDADEGKTLPEMLRQAEPLVTEMAGPSGKVLMLEDSAYFEKNVIEEMDRHGWRWIVGANQQRAVLTRLVQEQPAWQWTDTGGDARRGWEASEVCRFSHQPNGWSQPVTIVARRWRSKDELPGMWHYSFVGTRLEPSDLPLSRIKKYGFAAYIWMLYSTKQGYETHYKTPLSDLGLHHPPSGRLGVDQAYYTLMTAAANIAMVLRYRVLPKEDYGMQLWRIRERYFEIPGRVAISGRTLKVTLAGGQIDADRKRLWLAAFACAGRL